MSESSLRRSDEFLAIAEQFKLGVLTTESSHPVTAELSETAKRDIGAALDLLFDVDHDVVEKYREFARSGRAREIADAVRISLEEGGRVFFTGCGSTGRLSIQLASIWRDFWQRQRSRGIVGADEYEDRVFPVMAGGDFALIKAVEGFEDFTAFGGKQIGDLGVGAGDVVFAITEGGETSFVIGTAWKGLEVGAKVYFVYNNPDEVLVEHVRRSREVILEPRIEKINLTTGPMAITGSTRMQATTIQLCVMLTVLEMAARDLMRGLAPDDPLARDSSAVPDQFAEKLAEMHSGLRSPELLAKLARLVSLEETVYRTGHKNNYYADALGVDVLTDTTERSPTFCTPPYRKFDDSSAAESWSFLFVPYADTPTAWQKLIKRRPRCVEWSEDEVKELVGDDKASRVYETVTRISCDELMRFRIGGDGLRCRELGPGDCAVGIVHETEKDALLGPGGFVRTRLEAAQSRGAGTGLVFFGRDAGKTDASACPPPECVFVPVTVPETDFLLDGVTRAGVKMLLNALSTCTMVRLGRVMGNYMIWVVPSNLKLIDRSTRYISRLTGLSYEDANRLLFEVIEYVEPRMKADQAYPPVVGVAVMRARHGLTNEQAERKLMEEIGL
mgnify:CR=1 FL=1